MGFLHGHPKEFTENRWRTYEKAAGKAPPLPPIDAGLYLFDAFFQAGLADSSANGLQALAWSEIHAFSKLTGDITEAWEAKLLRAMSKEYIEGRKIGDDPLGIEPWS